MKNTIIRLVFASACLIHTSTYAATPSTTFTSWNLEWLTLTPSNKIEESHRTSKDFEVLNSHWNKLESDVLAFQEVDSADAIQEVVGKSYKIFLSDRANKTYRNNQFKDINQYTGFAVRKGISVKDVGDVRLATSANSKLRFGSYIILFDNTPTPIHALSVHLKAGCSGAYNNSKSCRKLKAQGAAINDWIKQREKANEQYIILGDFNHNMAYKKDWLWESIAQNNSAELTTRNTKANCKVRSKSSPHKSHQFRAVIDHIIVSSDLNAAQTEQVPYKTQQVLDYQLSDHCPVSTKLK